MTSCVPPHTAAHSAEALIRSSTMMQSLRTATRLIPCLIANNARCLSSSPDYLNYETWHRGNYEHHGKVLHNGHHLNDNGRYANHFQGNHLGKPTELPRTSVLMELSDRVGALHDVLKYLWVHGVSRYMRYNCSLIALTWFVYNPGWIPVHKLEVRCEYHAYRITSGDIQQVWLLCRFWRTSRLSQC